MVGTGNEAGLQALLIDGTEFRTAMPAGVVKGGDGAFAILDENKVLPADREALDRLDAALADD